MPDKSEILLQTEHLDVHFPLKKETPFAARKFVQAVSDVSLTIHRGEIFGLVGESGCGKSTFADTTLGILRPTGGNVLFDGEALDRQNKARFKQQRRRMQKIFQDPASSLNPRFTVQDAIAEPLRIRGGFTAAQQTEMTVDMLRKVGLSEHDRTRNVTEFSGGQQQRIAIARALILKPDYLVCDEPVSALDVSVHAQILNLLTDLRAQTQVTYLFISHNLAVVQKFCDRMAILYLGKVVEFGSAARIFQNPLHPYTQALFSAIPIPDPTVRMNRIVLEGSIPSPANPPQGCKFHTRCRCCMEKCKHETPVQREIEPGHYVVCHLYDEEVSADEAAQNV